MGKKTYVEYLVDLLMFSIILIPIRVAYVTLFPSIHKFLNT